MTDARPTDERVCPKHQGGAHCWHHDNSLNKGYRGKYETFVPVVCCHCNRTGTRLDHGAEYITYD